MSCQPSLSKSAKEAPQNQPTGFAPAFHVTSSNVPSPLFLSSVFPEPICRNTLIKPKPDCRKISKYIGMSVFHVPCRRQFWMQRKTVGGSPSHMCSERMLVQ